ncbi:16S rRNA (cytosine(967)-C(5))-methyltransferase [Legionella quinlivanii]|uniref:16S rRNA (cytosine(967)-C(5))-methyltransferase n=1 Tax=Legionella quinlivanii TaxID=45073 RepID=A0A364LHP2_9GAMM|nr:16S rRNA (cytosine(967)-C(5))-methyltransferase RsmB [Legionella quinlivanii]RAP35761.1 16S rRNA (cytosine(967)-C(5))-methyltransferase [Legionella quinlivanii]
MKPNERAQALKILIDLFENKVSLNQSLQSAEISPLTKAICFGVCRYYYRLELIARQLLNKKPEAPEIWLLILMGLFQLQYLNKPEYATVQETVALLDRLKKSWAKGLINAVLRRFCREKEVILASLENNPAYSSNHPQWFIKALKKDWPNNYQYILTANDQHPPLYLRTNQLKTSRDAYLAQLEQAGIEVAAPSYLPHGIQIDTAVDIRELPGYAEGYFSVQDGSAQAAVKLLALEPGLRVLDACCAPGGKTSYILESQADLQECVAVDVEQRRLQRVQENLARLQLKATVLQGNVLTPSDWWDGQLFDRILLDAPCSATGVIRRHPDIKIIRQEQDIDPVVSLQKQLLHAVWPLLKKGGLLVYATCSILKRENEDQIKAFLKEQSECRVLPINPPWGSANEYGWQILPGQENCDGFFYSVLRKD